jgi:multidrug resistance efflux pump
MLEIDSLVKLRLPLSFKGRNYLKYFLFLLPLILISPWIAFTVGTGQVTAINPNERIQTISAPVTGFIKEWHVSEGDEVKEGEVIADLVDNDPSLMERLERENEASKRAMTSAKLMMDTAKLDLDRQRSLFEQGLSARKDYEKAKIEFSKYSVEYSKALSTLTKSETQLSRQSTQRVIAPKNGVITRILPAGKGVLIKAGSPIAVFAPEVKTPSVELWVDGNDISFLEVGQKANIQFEGWPAIQIAGWPSVSIGTFDAKVYLIDQASSHEGKFRVLLVPDSSWPSDKILRLGVHAKGYIRLADSFVLKEIWRQLNGFPPLKEPIQDELNKMLSMKSVKSEDKAQDEEGKK